MLKPAAPLLRGLTRLVIVPDEALWELPFQALHDGASYLIETHALSYAPSFSVLRALSLAQRTPPKNLSLLALGNPRGAAQTPAAASRTAPLGALPQAEIEVKALARLYGASHSRVYLGAAAREDRFKAEAKNYDVLHIAAHGLLNATSPLYSQVLLAANKAANEINNDGLLEAWELMKLDLRPQLVVLSACETGRGQLVGSEGVIGMSWALFVPGAPTAVLCN